MVRPIADALTACSFLRDPGSRVRRNKEGSLVYGRRRPSELNLALQITCIATEGQPVNRTNSTAIGRRAIAQDAGMIDRRIYAPSDYIRRPPIGMLRLQLGDSDPGLCCCFVRLGNTLGGNMC